MEGRSLIIKRIPPKGESSANQSIHLEDIPKDSPLYAKLQACLNTQKQSDTFASVEKEGDIDYIKSYENMSKKRANISSRKL